MYRYRHLLNVSRDHKWEAWIIYMLKGVEETAIWTREKIDTVQNLLAHTCQHVQKQLPAIYSRELVELIFSQRPFLVSRLCHLLFTELNRVLALHLLQPRTPVHSESLRSA